MYICHNIKTFNHEKAITCHLYFIFNNIKCSN